MILKYFRIVKQNHQGSSFLLPAHGWDGARATSLSFNISVPPPSEKIAGGFQQAGKKEGGLGEGILRLRSGQAFARLSKQSPAALLVQSRAQQKSFLFLLEEKIGWAQDKKCRENFFAGWRAAAGRSVKIRSPDFRQKKFGF